MKAPCRLCAAHQVNGRIVVDVQIRQIRAVGVLAGSQTEISALRQTVSGLSSRVPAHGGTTSPSKPGTAPTSGADRGGPSGAGCGCGCDVFEESLKN